MYAHIHIFYCISLNTKESRQLSPNESVNEPIQMLCENLTKCRVFTYVFVSNESHT